MRNNGEDIFKNQFFCCTCTVEQILLDAGCGEDTSAAFLKLLRDGRRAEGLCLLAEHRARLLEQIHSTEKELDALDYLIYHLKKD